MTAEDKLHEIEAKFTDFALNLTGQQSEWLSELRHKDRSNVSVRDSVRDASIHAFMVRVTFSIAYRLIQAVIQNAQSAVPKDLNKIVGLHTTRSEGPITGTPIFACRAWWQGRVFIRT